jgi:hypothetical protein
MMRVSIAGAVLVLWVAAAYGRYREANIETRKAIAASRK